MSSCQTFNVPLDHLDPRVDSPELEVLIMVEFVNFFYAGDFNYMLFACFVTFTSLAAITIMHMNHDL